MTALRVLQVDSGREWRGGQNQVRLLCRELARDPDVDVRLMTKENSELAWRTAASGIDVVNTAWSWGYDPRAVGGVSDEIYHWHPDVIHAHDSHALGVALAARSLYTSPATKLWPPFALLRLLLTKPRSFAASPPRVIGTRRVDFHVRRRRGLAARLLPDSPWRQADHVIALSDAIRRILVQDGLRAGEITVVPSGIDHDEVRAAAATPLGIRGRLGLPPGTPLAVNVAALVDHKDQITLIRAAAAARALRPDLHWAIAGDGGLRGSLAAEIARLDLRDRVHLVGYIDQADALIREADVFVMSSKEEGLGSVILNALALERPVVATAGGGIPEILPPEALVPVGDAGGLGRRVVEVLTHPPSPFPLPPRFTATAMAQGVLAVYRSLL